MAEQHDQTTSVAEAFNRKAPVYDQFTAINPHLQWLRRRVYDHVSSVMAKGSHILEINAGTGEDAVALIERGYRVHATDLAPDMIARVDEKIAQHGYTNELSAQLCSFTNLDQVEGKFDAVFSNSGGLNCINDLALITRHLPQKLRVGGIATWVVMPPFYPWELATAVKDWRVGTRRFAGKRGVATNVEGVKMTTYYFWPSYVRKCFGPQFSQVRLQSLNIFSPNADNYTFMHKAPRTYRLLRSLDTRLGDLRPFSSWGDFFIISMRYDGG